MTDVKIWELVKELTTEEKAALVSGADFWNTKSLASKDIPALQMADGPNGLRIENSSIDKENGYKSKPATCFPTASCLANSFSEELLHEIGSRLADEALSEGIGLVLAPGINIKRSPLCGRNFEYFSEDPVASGLLGAAFINGLQEKGVGACVKHFAVNNQETKRMSINTVVDERALFEIYLKPFEIAVDKAKPAAVMASYNKIDGEYACENRVLLTDILRAKFGFEGCVISDWGAINLRYRALIAGMDLEMPYSGNATKHSILKALKGGMLLEHSLDNACFNVLKLVFAYSCAGKQKPACRPEGGHELAIKALCQSSVLMKNDGLLPLKETADVAVIGAFAQKPRIQGSGSSLVNPTKLSSFTQALIDADIKFTYTPGYDAADARTSFAEAVQLAQNAENVIYFMGLPSAGESEGYDRENIALPQAQLDLLDKLCEVNKNICVVLVCGSPVEMPWLNSVQAVLYPGLGGQGFGEALHQLIFGHKCPAGKLSETWPVSLEGTPSYKNFPLGPVQVNYNESIYVGYRYYEKVRQSVLFPFGHGLSYTSFECGNIKFSHSVLPVNRSLKIQLDVKNTGNYDADEIVFVYMSNPSSKLFAPPRSLCGFGRTSVKKGESNTISIKIPYNFFAFYDPEEKEFIVENSVYDITLSQGPGKEIAKHSLHIRGKNTVGRQPQKQFGTKSYYASIKNNLFPDSEFEKLLDKPLENSPALQKGSYTMSTTLGEMTDSFAARMLLRLAVRIARSQTIAGPDKNGAKIFAKNAAADLPMKNLVLFSTGRITPKAARTLLDVFNGKKGMFKFIRQLLTKPL